MLQKTLRIILFLGTSSEICAVLCQQKVCLSFERHPQFSCRIKCFVQQQGLCFYIFKVILWMFKKCGSTILHVLQVSQEKKKNFCNIVGHKNSKHR